MVIAITQTNSAPHRRFDLPGNLQYLVSEVKTTNRVALITPGSESPFATPGGHAEGWR